MSYWCTEFLIVTVDGPGGQTVLPLDQPFARVGRHPEADVCLPHPGVPSRALYFHATRAGVFCLFLDRDDSGPDRTGIWLKPEQSVEVGPYRLRASLLTAEPEDSLPSDLPSAWGSAKPPLPVMMIYCGTRLKDKRRFRAILSPVGRRPQCALQLKGQKVSGFHCVLYWEQQRLWCIDLNSSNGTRRNGKEIVCEEVALGDRLEVGDFHLVFQRLSSGGRTGSSEPAELADEVIAALPAPQGQEHFSASENPAIAATGDRAAQVIPVRSLSRWKTDSNEDSQLELDDRTRSSAGLSSDSSAPSMLDTAAADSSVDTASRGEVERRRLHDELAAELARLAREREEMQAEWKSATAALHQKTDQLQAKLDAVEGEAARLERQRAELHAAQQAWQAEQGLLATRLAARGDQLTSLEAELAERTAQIESQLASVQQQAAAAEQAARARVAAELAAVERAAELAAAQAVAAQAAAAQATAAEVAAARRRQEELAAEKARRDSFLTIPSPAPDEPPPWSQATERLAAEIEQLRQQSLSLAAEKQSLDSARTDWQRERQTILDQLDGRSTELHRLEEDLHRSQQTLEARIEARLQEKFAEAAATAQLASTVRPSTPSIELDACPTIAAESTAQVVTLPLTEPPTPNLATADTASASLAPPVPVPPAAQGVAALSGPFVPEPHAASPEEQQMREFLNTRLRKLDEERSGRRWIWWTVGGAGFALLASVAFAVYKWIL